MRSGRLTANVARIRTVAGRGCSVMMPSSVRAGACPHSGKQDGGLERSGHRTGSSDHRTPRILLCSYGLSHRRVGQSSGRLRQRVRFSTRSPVPGFALVAGVSAARGQASPSTVPRTLSRHQTAAVDTQCRGASSCGRPVRRAVSDDPVANRREYLGRHPRHCGCGGPFAPHGRLLPRCVPPEAGM